jgi:aminocarboxymuconate-semialdehyde decarboxylase
MTVIDVHAHILPESAVRAFDQGRDWFGTTITKTADGKPGLQTGSYKMNLGAVEYWLPHQKRLPFMDEGGIDIQLLSLNPQLFRDHLDKDVAIACTRAVNDEIAETVSKNPARFQGLAALPLQDTDAALRELDRAMTELKLRGFIIGSHVAGTNWDDPRLFPILEEAANLGAFILQHPFNNRIREPLPRYHMVNLIGNPLETTIFAASLMLGGVLDRLPNLTICLSHTGGYLPFAVGRFDHAYALRADVRDRAAQKPSDYLRHFYYDCISHNDSAFEQVVERIGGDRILLGTDFPADMGIRHPVEWLSSLDFLTEVQLSDITGRNAEKLIFRQAPQR